MKDLIKISFSIIVIIISSLLVTHSNDLGQPTNTRTISSQNHMKAKKILDSKKYKVHKSSNRASQMTQKLIETSRIGQNLN